MACASPDGDLMCTTSGDGTCGATRADQKQHFREKRRLYPFLSTICTSPAHRHVDNIKPACALWRRGYTHGRHRKRAIFCALATTRKVSVSLAPHLPPPRRCLSLTPCPVQIRCGTAAAAPDDHSQLAPAPRHVGQVGQGAQPCTQPIHRRTRQGQDAGCVFALSTLIASCSCFTDRELGACIATEIEPKGSAHSLDSEPGWHTKLTLISLCGRLQVYCAGAARREPRPGRKVRRAHTPHWHSTRR